MLALTVTTIAKTCAQGAGVVACAFDGVRAGAIRVCESLGMVNGSDRLQGSRKPFALENSRYWSTHSIPQFAFTSTQEISTATTGEIRSQ